MVVRAAKEQDIPAIVDMLKRLKRLNQEFDTHFSISKEIEKNATEYLNKNLNDHENKLFLVADNGGKVQAFMEILFRKRIYYSPSQEARIMEFYVMPEYRMLGLGKKMMNELIKELRKKKITLISSEFPSSNMIARNFYEKAEFRQLISIYGKWIDRQN